MIGAVVFVVFFLLFLAITLVVPTLPPGGNISNLLGIPQTDYPVLGIPGWILINAIINGVVYGFIIWLIYTIIGRLMSRPQEKIEKLPEPQIQRESEIPITQREEAVAETTKPHGIPLIKIEGIGSVHREKLAAEGIETTGDLLKAGRTHKDREKLAERTGLSPAMILEWVNLADLIRIKGVSEEYSDLLEEAGVDTVVELSNRNPEKLHAKLVEINEEKNLVRRIPTLENVRDWVEQAKKLERAIEY